MVRQEKEKRNQAHSIKKPATTKSSSTMHLRSHRGSTPPAHAASVAAKRRRQESAATSRIPPLASVSSSSSEEDLPAKQQHIVIQNPSLMTETHASGSASSTAITDPTQSDEEIEGTGLSEDPIHASKHVERYQEQVPHFVESVHDHNLDLGLEAQVQHTTHAIEEDGSQLDVDVQELLWPSYTDIVPPAVPGNHLGLKVQSPAVQEVLRRGIRLVFVLFCFDQAFAYVTDADTSHASDRNCTRKALIRAARKLGENDIKHRLQQDAKYAKLLGSILQSRIDNWRSQLRENAACLVGTAYGLDKLQGHELQDHIDELLARHTHYYYLFAQDEHGEPNFKKPFLHPIFAQLLYKTFFSTSKQMGQVCVEAFKLKDGTYEMSEPLLALVATAVFAALDALRPSSARRRFCADAYSSVYEDVLETLHILATAATTKDSYHSLLAKIYAMSQSPLPGIGLRRTPLESAERTCTHRGAAELEFAIGSNAAFGLFLCTYSDEQPVARMQRFTQFMMPSHKASSARPTTPENASDAGDAATPRASRGNNPRTPTQSDVSSQRQNVQSSPAPAPGASQYESRAWGLHSSALFGDEELPPFGRHDEFNCRTVADLLRIQLPPAPPPKDDDSQCLSKTKEMSLTEMSLRSEERMTTIVYAPKMLDELIAKVKKELAMLKIDFDLDLDFIVATSPWHTSVGLPDVVHSEKDIEDWIGRVILAVSLHAVRALQNRGIPILQPPMGGPASTRGPYVSSCPGDKGSIADAAIHEKGHTVKAVVEVKCPNVLKISAEMQSDEENTEHVLGRLLTVPTDEDGNACPGLAIKFNWPSDEPPLDKGTKPPHLDTETRILVQIYTQLLKNQCDMGMLSAYLLSIFTHRVGDVMYLSRRYRSTGEILFATVAWMAVLLEVPGYERSKMDLPKPNKKLWNNRETHLSELYGAMGVVESTVPKFAANEQAPSAKPPSTQAAPPPGRAGLRSQSRHRE
ncbi:hypothetical protein NM688_g250 [Phlebia brevispora]|uniref:Uncharacterized protein n=1 Tax=Phlebia brevispora TaxID=194682 RepID=A0ACC1TEP5_9APHY|nr:hypothetical protein NM688_g250 [Phlebia brevispora]